MSESRVSEPSARPSPGEVLLRCRGVNKSYGGVQAVRGVSLDVHAGEILGLVGPNGAGKTTLVDVITGQQRADSGDISIHDIPLRGLPSRRSRKAGFARTFQHPQLALDLTVRENILIGAVANSMRSPLRILGSAFRGAFNPATERIDHQIEALADELHLGGIDRYCADLTLGEQRLVEVVRALIRNPTVLLLDEPFAGGDVLGVAGMTHALQRIVERGCGILLVDHNVDIVAALVNRIVLMDRGAVVFDGDPAECLRSEAMREVYFGAGTVIDG
jgi:branched-chain amino acid transport system ATP-binding protein